MLPISHKTLSDTLNYIKRYLNANLLINPITSFPESFIETDGAPLFEILSFLTSKQPKYPWKVGAEKGNLRVRKLYEQYYELIKMLKLEGAQLNHIRPEYLLSLSDLNTYLANLPSEKTQFYMPSLLKVNSSLYDYLSL